MVKSNGKKEKKEKRNRFVGWGVGGGKTFYN